MKNSLNVITAKNLLLRLFVPTIFIAAFGAYTAILGGDALGGRIEDGHFYLAHGAQYKEVSFSGFIFSAFLSLAASVAFFLLGNRVLHALELADISTRILGLRKVLNLFFGAICGWIAVYSIVVIWRAFSVPR